MKKLRKYLITLAVGLAAVLGILYAKDFFAQTELQRICHILCDAFFAVGTVMCCAGLLIFSANEGSFDMIVYGMNSFIDLFREKSRKKYDTFFDYKESRKGQKVTFGFLLICGLLFLAVSLAVMPFAS